VSSYGSVKLKFNDVTLYTKNDSEHPSGDVLSTAYDILYYVFIMLLVIRWVELILTKTLHLHICNLNILKYQWWWKNNIDISKILHIYTAIENRDHTNHQPSIIIYLYYIFMLSFIYYYISYHLKVNRLIRMGWISLVWGMKNWKLV